MVRIDTKNGTIRFKLYEKETPVTTGNFIGLVDRGFYNGLTFHRVEPGFVVQGGDPKGDGTGGSGKNIPLEVVPGLKHDGPGVVAMARSSDPNSASCQFYITMGPAPHLDGGYAVFGRVIEGQEVVNKIVRGDKMDKVTIEGAASPSAASGSDAGQSDVAGTTK
ncbi:MAG: peptidylprolyl isomerase [Candidatus Sericytochromatia bacterium]|nr:peptidylprolyl isomerase [Candidatus Sericytochromatia bacterium]